MATQDEEYLPAYEQDFRAGREIPKYVQEAKARAWERDFAWQIGYSLLPKHPAMTGEYKCWLCIKEPQPREGEEKANPFTFEVETRRGDDLLLSYEEREAARKAGKKIENKVRTAIFCDLECYMEGWPAVRRDFILAGGRAKEKPVGK